MFKGGISYEVVSSIWDDLLIMSNAEQKQSLVNDYNKQLDEDGVTETLKVPIS